MNYQTFGVLGVGHLASYTIKGLRNSGDLRRIILSPRGARTAAELSESCNCHIAIDNQSVIDQSDIVLLAVRPDGLEDLLQDLSFKPDQLVISAIAGVSLDQLRQFPPLQSSQLVRVIPSTSAEVCSGPVPLYPANPVAEQLFNQIGNVVPLPSEDLFDISLSHACLHGWSYFLIQQLIDWSCAQGMDADTARKMVAYSISSAVDFAEAQPELSYGDIGRAIATEGTFTQRGISRIEASGGLQSWVDAMQSMIDDQR
ncbi:NAD(P)-binding domain-containing protein [Oceanospirillum sediminis]|uniref:NAD(P)-binding domain-containing protein n=1 Tax=Oceanospirillum sediminis TaxID=2760088 RepID=A0A839IVU7_9GAMM|nr:NAD(P)-binding domain-containing protein [Oceanospirillum sediminis]MBB1488507.1 NAD(P)-binding domain-containing protein [Oceanospirillum sediminis]